MTRLAMHVVQLVASLVLSRHFILAAPVRESASASHMIGAHTTLAQSRKGFDDLLKIDKYGQENIRGIEYVKDYTLTEPHPDGKSYKHDEYDKGKLFVDPVTHRSGSWQANTAPEKNIKDYHDRNIDRNEFILQSNKQAAGEDALQDISKGKVVRQAGHEGVMLLHHTKMDPKDARHLHNHNAVHELTQKGNVFNYRATSPLRRHEETGKPLKPLTKEERAKMEEALHGHVKSAQQAHEDSKRQTKLWHNPKTHKAEPDPQRDVEVKKQREEDARADEHREKWRKSRSELGRL